MGSSSSITSKREAHGGQVARAVSPIRSGEPHAKRRAPNVSAYDLWDPRLFPESVGATGPEPPRRQGRGATQRSAAQQAANSRAQRRYRDKAKQQRAEMEQRVAHLTHEVLHLRQANQQLGTLNASLESENMALRDQMGFRLYAPDEHSVFTSPESNRVLEQAEAGSGFVDPALLAHPAEACGSNLPPFYVPLAAPSAVLAATDASSMAASAEDENAWMKYLNLERE